MRVHGVKRILTFDEKDFARFVEIEAHSTLRPFLRDVGNHVQERSRRSLPLFPHSSGKSTVS